MKKIRNSNENEMIYEFLKMEINSERYRDQIETVLKELSADKEIIINGNITSVEENTLRAEILKRFRGWRNEELFENFPVNINWVWSAFDREDILKVIYIEYSYWNELSNYTGSPLEAAKYVLSGRTIYDMPTDGFIGDAQRLIEGHKFPPLIFLTDRSEERYIILEGHCRMTAYGLAPVLFQNVSVLLGYCDREELNKWYGEMPERPK
ncbi:MAG: hypothetical protein FWD71_22145 [Oscillospiraceae bacterium]|nr:hypothetical protein [Oscillospiraceae bacterium]